MSSFQGVRIEWPPLYMEMSSFHGRGSTVYRGVLILGGWVPPVKYMLGVNVDGKIQ